MSGPMLTTWSQQAQDDWQQGRTVPHPEHPRPQLVREPWLTLNGHWDYAITPVDPAVRSMPAADGKILVPFSPEAPLSGVHRTLLPSEHLWYRRILTLPADLVAVLADGGRLLLHFGAVDQSCEVSLNGRPVGGHVGGFTPFTLDLTEAVDAHPEGVHGNHELVVRVRDLTDTSHHSRGKQVSRPGGIWYSPQSGIWQTVWLEGVGALSVERLEIVPGLRHSDPVGGPEPSVSAWAEVTVHARGGSGSIGSGPVSLTLRDPDGSVVAEQSGHTGQTLRLSVADPRLWTPEHPHLYDLQVTCGQDRVTSYVALRTTGTGPDAQGITRLLLNGEPRLQAGLLDQGYWPDGLLTAPSDEAFVHDITTAKDLGFTMLRKHIKLEPMRWYHHCDRLGMLVWQDMVNGGRAYRMPVITTPVAAPPNRPARLDDSRHRLFGRQDAEGREQFLREVEETVQALGSVPSIVVWVPFNEGWGQFDAHAVAAQVAALDPNRVIDHASGWYDQGGGDLVSRHVYFRRYRLSKADVADPRAAVLSEYGGYSHRVPGHTWSEKEFGYRRIADRGTFERAFLDLQARQVRPAISQGLAAFVYTQLSDVEEESNGLLTYDRKVLKVDVDRVRASHASLRAAFDTAVGRAPEPIAVTERELTEPVDLTLSDGRLNPAAVGWCRTPLVDTDRIGAAGSVGRGRNKRWEYWALTTPAHVLAVVVSDIGYAGVNGLWLLDRRTQQAVSQDLITPLGRGVRLPGTLGRGAAGLDSRTLQVLVTEESSGTRIRVAGKRIEADVVVARPRGHESLGVVVPWSDRLFQYTVKDIGRPATGWLSLDGERTTLPEGDTWASLDHGRGRWPHRVHWNWGAGAGRVDGAVIGLQVGGRWTDGTGSVENAITVDGRLHKISEELHWSYDPGMRGPWRIRGAAVDLTLTPEYLKSADTDLTLLSSHSRQAFGTWSGQALGYRVDGLFGWAEDVHQKW